MGLFCSRLVHVVLAYQCGSSRTYLDDELERHVPSLYPVSLDLTDDFAVLDGDNAGLFNVFERDLRVADVELTLRWRDRSCSVRALIPTAPQLEVTPVVQQLDDAEPLITLTSSPERHASSVICSRFSANPIRGQDPGTPITRNLSPQHVLRVVQDTSDDIIERKNLPQVPQGVAY